MDTKAQPTMIPKYATMTNIYTGFRSSNTYNIRAPKHTALSAINNARSNMDLAKRSAKPFYSPDNQQHSAEKNSFQNLLDRELRKYNAGTGAPITESSGLTTRPMVDPYNPKIHRTSVTDARARQKLYTPQSIKRGPEPIVDKMRKKVRQYVYKTDKGEIFATKAEHQPKLPFPR